MPTQAWKVLRNHAHPATGPVRKDRYDLPGRTDPGAAVGVRPLRSLRIAERRTGPGVLTLLLPALQERGQVYLLRFFRPLARTMRGAGGSEASGLRFDPGLEGIAAQRSAAHTSEIQSLLRSTDAI